MDKLKLNKSLILNLADNTNLDEFDDACIRNAEEIYLGYNKNIKLLCLYNEEEDIVCRVNDLVEDPAKLARNDEELKEQMEFTLTLVPFEDALKSFAQKCRQEYFAKISDA